MALSVRYMGSKRSLAPLIAERITADHPTAAVLDVFAGMCAVGSELANRHVLLTNDIHAFASTVAEALFVAGENPPTSLNARDELMTAFRRNRKALQERFSSRLHRETELLARAEEGRHWRSFLAFNDEELGLPTPNLAEGLIDAYRTGRKRFPYCLVSTYFSSSYFGIAQAIDLDSIRYAIAMGPPRKRAYYLAALIQAASQCAAAPGHFAQYLVPRDRRTSRYVARFRRRSVLDRFFAALDNFPRVECKSRISNRVFNGDALDVLKNKRRSLSKRDLVIYADPPYSRAQYSRYYHVLETIVLYDYPASVSKGRYRSDRHQTAFSQIGGVAQAMDNLIGAAADTGASLYLSYPTNGLLFEAGHDLELLLKKYYKVVRLVADEPLRHSTLGAAPGSASVQVQENVYYGGWC